MHARLALDWRRGLDLAQAVLAALGAAWCLRAGGHHLFGLALALALPCLRFALSPPYRRRVLTWFGARFAEVHSFNPADARLPWKATFALVVAPAVVLYLSGNHALVQGDSRPVVLTACSLVADADWDVREYVPDPLPYFVVKTPSGIHSSYPSGMVSFALPVAAAGRLLGADLTHPKTHERMERFAAAWVSAACLGLFFLIALHLGDARAALATTCLLASGSAMFTTVGQGLWQHGGVIFWGLTALLVEFRRAAGHHSGAAPPIADTSPKRKRGWTSLTLRASISQAIVTRSIGATLLQGVACGSMVACRLSAGLFVLPLGLWLLVREPRRALAVGAVAALAFAPWALLHRALYGNLIGPSVVQMAGNCWSGGVSDALLGVLFSPGRGLFVYQPWLVLLLLAPLAAGRREGAAPSGWWAFCLVFAALHVALVSAWGCWWGGHCWGSRLASETVPFLALFCVRPVSLLLRSAAGRWLVVAVALAGFWVHASAVYLRADRWNDLHIRDRPERMLWSWSDPPYLCVGRRAVGD